jgi:hypothetical protein
LSSCDIEGFVEQKVILHFTTARRNPFVVQTRLAASETGRAPSLPDVHQTLQGFDVAAIVTWAVDWGFGEKG